MQAVIIYDSVTGNTRNAANLIADELFRHDIGANLFKVNEVNPDAVAEADLVVVGTWTDGLILVGQKPGRHKRFTSLLPDLTGHRCAVFCTFAVNPGRTLDKLQGIVEGHGGEVLGGMAIRRDDLDGGSVEFANRLVGVIAG